MQNNGYWPYVYASAFPSQPSSRLAAEAGQYRES